MLAPVSWLKEFVDINVSPQEFMDRMTMIGSEVEGLEELGLGMEQVVVGKISSISKHPNADRLQICQLDVGAEVPSQIVTGATNVFEGALVPVALPGAKLPCGIAIKASKLRGVDSAGMLCSGQELCINDSVYPGAEVDGIMILHESYIPGTSIRDVLNLNDIIIDFKTYANRPDCLSIIGMAREASVALGEDFKPLTVTVAPGVDSVDDYVSVEVEDTEKCPRYIARVVKNIRIAPSPEWMQQHLIAAGVRPINNIVDITNYVMLEQGQPMHAFDLSYVKDHKIIVRTAKPGESIVTLDGKERSLQEDMLVICDSEKPSAVAGIMGGEYSGVYENTKEVLFEGAAFLGSSIRSTSRKLGLRTESSARFEKGLDIDSSRRGIDRAIQLVQLLNAGDVVEGYIDVCSKSVEPRMVVSSAAAINRLLGQNLSAQQISDILHRVFVEVQADAEGVLNCTIPLFRDDIWGTADLAEEVQRVYGYDKIPSNVKLASAGRGHLTANQQLVVDLKQLLAAMDFYEAYNYSFINPASFDMLLMDQQDNLRKTVTILNPLGADTSVMRTTLIPGLLANIASNYRHRNEKVHLFEMGKIYLPKSLPVLEQPDEILTLGLAILDKSSDFFDLKGVVERLLDYLGIRRYKIQAGGPSWLHPGRCATLIIGQKVVGSFGELHPDVQANFDVNQRILAAELNIEVLMAERNDQIKVKPLPKFPGVSRDLAVVVDEEIPAGSLLETIRKEAGELLESLSIFDIYRGEQLPSDKKGIAFSMVFRSNERTLVFDDVNSQMEQIIMALDKSFGAALRS